MIKKTLLVAGLILACSQLTNAQDISNKNLVKFQYLPDKKHKKNIIGKIENIFKTKFGNTELHWVKLTGDTVIHIWPKDMDKNIAVGNTYTFNGVKRLYYNFKRKKVK